MSFFDKLRTQKFLSFTLILFTLSIGIVIGTLITSGVKAAKENPGKWKDWYWVCFGCMIFFLLTVPLMRGRWSPKKAREDEDAHEAMVQAEMAKLGLTANA